MSRRVVVTGTGVLSPIGNSTQEFYNGLKHGANGIGAITSFDSSNFNVHIAGEVKITLEDYFDKNYGEKFDKYTDTLLYLAARNEHILKVIKPALTKKKNCYL